MCNKSRQHSHHHALFSEMLNFFNVKIDDCQRIVIRVHHSWRCHALVVWPTSEVACQMVKELTVADSKHCLALHYSCHFLELLDTKLDSIWDLLLGFNVLKSAPAFFSQNVRLILWDSQFRQQIDRLGASQTRENLSTHIDSMLLMDLSHDLAGCRGRVHVVVAHVL